MALFLFCASMWLAGHKSFHQDELAVLSVEKRALTGRILEAQHLFYHRFYQWWLADDFGERYARIPSALFVSLGLLSLAALAGRLDGRRLAIVAGAAYLLWPRAWDDALEMRYYGLVFLCATLGLHGFLSMLKGRIFWPMTLLSALLVLVLRWHPTAIPFHGALLMAGTGICGVKIFHTWKTWKKDPEKQPFPWKGIVAPSLFILIALIGTIAIAPIVYRYGGGHLWNRIQVIWKGNFKVYHLFVWLHSWVDDRFSNPFPLIRVLRGVFPALLFIGLVTFYKKNPWMVRICFALMVIQIVLAGVFAFQWERLSISAKYLTSTSVFLLLCLSFAVLVLHDWASKFGKRRVIAIWAGFFLLYIMPVSTRVVISAFGDGSHLRQMWETVLEDSGETSPIVWGSSGYMQSVRPYTVLMPELNVTCVPYYFHDKKIVPALFGREQPAYTIETPKGYRQTPFRPIVQLVKRMDSNFTPNWSMCILKGKGSRQVLPGDLVNLNETPDFAVLESGNWRLNSPNPISCSVETEHVLKGLPNVIRTEEKTISPGESIHLEQYRYYEFEINQSDQPIQLIPDAAASPIHRSGGFAQVGPLEENNHPVIYNESISYELATSSSVEYDLYIPKQSTTLSIGTRTNSSFPDGVYIQLNEELFGLYSLIENDGTVLNSKVFHLQIPEEYQGQTVRISLTRIRDSEHYINSSFEKDALCLDWIELSERTNEIDLSPNLFSTEGFVAMPSWIADGTLDFTRPNTADRWNADFFGEEASDISIVDGEEGDRFILTKELNTCLIYLPPLAVKEGEILIPEIEVRTKNLIRKNAVLSVHYFSKNSETVGSDVLGELAIDRTVTTWTKKRSIAIIPKGADICIFGLYINSPPFYRLREDPMIEVKSLKFLKYTGRH